VKAPAGTLNLSMADQYPEDELSLQLVILLIPDDTQAWGPPARRGLPYLDILTTRCSPDCLVRFEGGVGTTSASTLLEGSSSSSSDPVLGLGAAGAFFPHISSDFEIGMGVAAIFAFLKATCFQRHQASLSKLKAKFSG
jgi:hypothetical protein